VLGELALIEAVLLAIVLAPTDAALGQAVVTDPRVPSRVRQGLNVESGLNDGICVPLLLIAIAIAQAEEGAIGNGAAVELVLEEIGYGCVGGVVAGLAAAAVVRVGVPRRLVDSMWLQVVPVAGATLAYGLAVWMGGSGFIAAFVGGAVFGGLRREVGGEVTRFLEETGNLLGAATFVLFGAVMLVPMLDDLSAEIVLYSLLSLTLVRMIPVGLAMLGSGARRPTIAFLGWFGPRGLASIVFAVILVEDAHLANESVLLNTIFLTIALSVLLHGLTATPLTARYAAWFAAHPRAAVPPFESAPAPEQRPHRWAGLPQEHEELDDTSPGRSATPSVMSDH
jgi:NhaP-type Na+/H+ or K+/H+ antiporter